MKNQIRSLQVILFLLLAVISLDAFTRPADADPITYDIVEGKILAAENRQPSMQNYEFAKNDYQQMKRSYEQYVARLQPGSEDLQKLSMLAQTLYMYEIELGTTKFQQLSPAQQSSFLTRLNTIKLEFYSALRGSKK